MKNDIHWIKILAYCVFQKELVNREKSIIDCAVKAKKARRNQLKHLTPRDLSPEKDKWYFAPSKSARKVANYHRKARLAKARYGFKTNRRYWLCTAAAQSRLRKLTYHIDVKYQLAMERLKILLSSKKLVTNAEFNARSVGYRIADLATKNVRIIKLPYPRKCTVEIKKDIPCRKFFEDNLCRAWLLGNHK